MISDADLAGMRTAVDSLLPSLALITRTGKSVDCRVEPANKQARLEGLPRFMPVPSWEITFPDLGDPLWQGTDVRRWDELTVVEKVTGENLGTFTVTMRTAKSSISTATVVEAVRSSPSVVGLTERDPQTPSTGKMSVHLNAITLRGIAEYDETSVSQQMMSDTFGAAMEGVYRKYANWPDPADWFDSTQANEAYPVKVSDRIVLKDGTTWSVRATEMFPPFFMVLYVAKSVAPPYTAMTDDPTVLTGLVRESPSGPVILTAPQQEP